MKDSNRDLQQIARLDKLFHPKSITIVGVSSASTALGGSSFLRRLLDAGYDGRIYRRYRFLCITGNRRHPQVDPWSQLPLRDSHQPGALPNRKAQRQASLWSVGSQLQRVPCIPPSWKGCLECVINPSLCLRFRLPWGLTGPETWICLGHLSPAEINTDSLG